MNIKSLVLAAVLMLPLPTASAQLLPNVYLAFEPFHANNIYEIGERAG